MLKKTFFLIICTVGTSSTISHSSATESEELQKIITKTSLKYLEFSTQIERQHNDNVIRMATKIKKSHNEIKLLIKTNPHDEPSLNDEKKKLLEQIDKLDLIIEKIISQNDSIE